MNELMTLCVIDDIKSVIEGITEGIPWAEHGVEIIGASRNGEDGLRMISDLQPNIILTDIRMPRMDGLEMTKQVLELLPASKVILISGYADFEYAQTAIRLGAFDFVKKPFSMEEIVAVVTKAKREIESERKKEMSLHAMEQRLKESMPILRQEYFNLLLHHKSRPEAARERWSFLQVDVEPQDITVMLIEIDRFDELSAELPVREAELIRFALQNIVEETISERTKGVIFRETQSRFAAVMNMTDASSAGTVAEQVRANIEKYTKFTISVGIGRPVEGPERLSESYQVAAKMLSHHFYAGGNAVFHYAHIREGFTLPPHYVRDHEEQFLFSLRSANQANVLSLLEDLQKEIKSMDPLPKPEYMEMLYAELLSLVIRVLMERLPYESTLPLERRCLELRERSATTWQELHQEAKSICMEACSMLESLKVSEAEESINKALTFIMAHLDDNLTVNMCAKQVHLSSSYFTSLFKKVTGMTFIQYVTQERIKQAKSMLIDNKQVQEIAQALGYEERRYFSDVFKKHTGMTPSEFRQAYTEGSIH